MKDLQVSAGNTGKVRLCCITGRYDSLQMSRESTSKDLTESVWRTNCLVRKGTKNEYGQFMYLEPITLIPMDLDAINPDIMSKEDKKLLNDYHAKVYEVIAPYLNEEEQEWLKKYTRAV